MKRILTFFRKLWQCLFCWEIPFSSEEELSGADFIIVPSFGARENSPGLSNEILAKNIDRLCLSRQLPVIAQWEVAKYLKKASPLFIVKEHTIPEEYLDTLEVVHQVWRFCFLRKLKRAIIVAHQDHLWRVTMLMKKIGFTPLIAPLTYSVPYDKKSVQWRTRGRLRFIICEIPCRIYSLLRGWI